MLDNPPTAGSGVHEYLFSVSRNLYAHLPESQIESLLRAKLANCGRNVPDRELKAAVHNAARFAWRPKPGTSAYRAIQTKAPERLTALCAAATANAAPPAAPKPKPDYAKIERLQADMLGLPDLCESSPVSFDTPNTEYFIDQLFPGDPFLCCGESAFKFNTLPRELWRDQLHDMAFIVPSPMLALTGKTQEGKESAHCLANTGPRRFLVIEFDFSEFGRDGKTETPWAPMLRRLKKHRHLTVQDICANLLLRLGRVRPMVMAVSSGGKSVHGWWYCAGHPEEKTKQFHDYAITLGADPATWRRSQFVRMPDGTRENGKPQTVLYFNPSALSPHGQPT